MSYTRWTECKYYSYGMKGPSSLKESQILVVMQSTKDPDSGTHFSYDIVLKMLEVNDFTAVWGYKDEDQALLKWIFMQFAADVDEEFRGSDND